MPSCENAANAPSVSIPREPNSAPEAASQIRKRSCLEQIQIKAPVCEKATFRTHTPFVLSLNRSRPVSVSHNMVSPPAALTTRFPSGATVKLSTFLVWSLRTGVAFPPALFQSRTVRSFDTETRRDPSGENTMSVTALSWPRNVPWRFPSPALQMYMVSPELDATRSPAGEKMTDSTSPEWPPKTARAFLLTAVHSCTVRSVEPVAICARQRRTPDTRPFPCGRVALAVRRRTPYPTETRGISFARRYYRGCRY